MFLLLLVIYCAASGFALVSLGLPASSSSCSYGLFRGSLAMGYGVGLFSVIFMLARAFDVSSLLTLDLLALALLSVAWFLVRRRSTIGDSLSLSRNAQFPLPPQRFLSAAFAVALCVALYYATLRSIAFPQGNGWDAYAIWNLHARFLYRAGADWREGFSALIPWSHPDYPLLLPASIAHFWSCLGREDQSVPAIIGLIFTFGTVGLLFSSLHILRNRSVAMLGGLVLLTTPFFIDTGTSQYADVPLAFFFLATIALLCLYDANFKNSRMPAGLVSLAALAASFAAWTKNEGLLFMGAIVVVRLTITVGARRRSTLLSERSAEASSSSFSPDNWRALAWTLVSAVPILLLIAWFKHSIAPAGDLFANLPSAILKVRDANRYWIICKWFGKEFLRFGHWFVFPGTLLLAGLYLAVGRKSQVPPPPGFHSSVITLALTLAGYFVIYVITPYDLFWHLRFSLARLLLQLWPSAIFLFFLHLRLGMGRTSSSVAIDLENDPTADA